MDFLAQAQAAFDQRDFPEVISLLDAQRLSGEQDLTAACTMLFNTAVFALDKKDGSLAIDCLERILAIDPYHTRANGLLCLMARHDLRSARFFNGFGVFDLSRIVPTLEYLNKRSNRGIHHTVYDGTKSMDVFQLNSIAVTGAGIIPRSLGDGILLLGTEGEILRESIGTRDLSHLIAQTLKTKGPREYYRYRRGSYAILCGFGASRLEHWQKIELPAAKSYVDAQFGGTYLIPAMRPEFSEPLQALGIPASRIEAYDGAEYLLEESWFACLRNS